ncbi:MAG: response regulator transcription factor [Bacteroidales bacterium]|nr:response regulator transcription factor [Bacteroidales bacterium]
MKQKYVEVRMIQQSLPIRSVVVDDEPDALDILESLLTAQGVEVVARAGGVDEALKYILLHRPDVVFLDIDMPVKNGFDLVKELERYDHRPSIVFVTAFNRFAIEAIRHAAFDYLLKPVDIDELRACLSRLQARQPQKEFRERVDELLYGLGKQKLRFHTRTGFIHLDPSEIVYFEAHGSYCDLVCIDGKQRTVSVNLGTLEETMPDYCFFRINRSLAVNRQYIRQVDRRTRIITLQAADLKFEFSISPKYIRKLEKEG